MKKLFLFSLLAIVCVAMQAQTSADSLQTRKNVFAVDATGLLSRFLNLNGQGDPQGAFLFSYRRMIGRNALRAGVDFGLVNGTGHRSDSVNTIDKSSRFAFGIGYERYFPLQKRWSLFAGADLLFGMQHRYLKSETVGIQSAIQDGIGYSYGVSGRVGLLFQINSRIGVDTHAGYRFIFQTSSTTYTFAPVNDYGNTLKDKTIITGFFPPISLNLRVSF